MKNTCNYSQRDERTVTNEQKRMCCCTMDEQHGCAHIHRRIRSVRTNEWNDANHSSGKKCMRAREKSKWKSRLCTAFIFLVLLLGFFRSLSLWDGGWVCVWVYGGDVTVVIAEKKAGISRSRVTFALGMHSTEHAWCIQYIARIY